MELFAEDDLNVVERQLRERREALAAEKKNAESRCAESRTRLQEKSTELRLLETGISQAAPALSDAESLFRSMVRSQNFDPDVSANHTSLLPLPAIPEAFSPGMDSVTMPMALNR